MSSSSGEIPETQNRSGGRWRVDEYVGSEGQRSSESLAQTQCDSSSRMIFALKGLSGSGLRVARKGVKVKT